MKVRRISSMKIAQGWRSRAVYIALTSTDVVSISVYVSPTGVELVQCLSGEKPEFVARPRDLPPLPLRRYEGSAAQRRAQRVKDRDMVNLSWAQADLRRKRGK